MKTISKIYFSPTGGTKKTVDAMADAIGSETVDYDVTVDANPAPNAFTADDFVIFGMPVYGSRIPKVAAARIKGFTGDQTPCIVAAVYGNVRVGDALVELEDIAKAHGFVVKGGAAVIARHTFGEIQTARPRCGRSGRGQRLCPESRGKPGRQAAQPARQPAVQRRRQRRRIPPADHGRLHRLRRLREKLPDAGHRGGL